MSNPEQLLHTVVFTLGLYLALHTGKEHRALHSPGFNSQIQIVHAGHETHLEYAEDIGLKTNKGGLHQCKFQTKHVPIYPIADKSRCPVNVFLMYIGKLNPKRICSALYLCSKKLYTPADWYLNVPVGVNTLTGVVKNLCKKAGIQGKFTNHSLHAMCATHLYQGGFDEQIVTEFTGHQSLAVHSYKETIVRQKHKAVETISVPPKEGKFD